MTILELSGRDKFDYIELLISDKIQLEMCGAMAFPGGARDHDFFDFVRNSMMHAKYLFVALCGSRPMAFLTAFNHRFKTTLAGAWPKPICRRHELYLDIVCAVPRTGAGKAVISALYKKARRLNKSAIRLFAATDTAFSYWERKGYREVDRACDPRARRRTYRYKRDPAAGLRMTICLDRAGEIAKRPFCPSGYGFGRGAR